MSYTKAIAKFICETSFPHLPETTIEATRACIKDSIGCQIGGASSTIGSCGSEIAKWLGESSSATLLGKTIRSSTAGATFSNALSANALDYCDTYELKGKAIAHPGSTIIPAALAVAEEIGATGTDLILAVALGYEVSLKVGEAVQPSKERYKAVWGLNTFPTLGAAVAAGKLLGLNEDAMANCLGLAGTFTAVPSAWKWNWTERPLSYVKDNVAIAAFNGVLASRLACMGYLGCRDILDGENGYWAMIGSDRCQWEVLLNDLGENYRIERVSFKPYPCCRWIHTTLDAAGDFSAECHPSEIESVMVFTYSDIARNFHVHQPKTPIDGQFSVPYTLALQLHGIAPGPKWYESECMRSPELLKTAQKIAIIADNEADEMYFNDNLIQSTVKIKLKNGKILESFCKDARGSQSKPLTIEEIKEKFSQLTMKNLGGNRGVELYKKIGALHHIQNIHNMLDLAIPVR